MAQLPDRDRPPMTYARHQRPSHGDVPDLEALEAEPALVGESLADVTERLFARFEGAVPLPTIARVVRRCRRELDIAGPGALPELLERLAYQRLRTLTAVPSTDPPAR